MANRGAARERDGQMLDAGASQPVVEHSRVLQGLESAAARAGTQGLVVAELGGPVTAQLLQQAGYRVQRRHPALRARFSQPTGPTQPVWVEFCEPDIDRVGFEEVRRGPTLTNGSASLWQHAAEVQANRHFDSGTEYGFRITWVPKPCDGGYVIIATPRSLVDGASMLRLLSEILDESAKLTHDRSRQHYDPDALDALPPPQSFIATHHLNRREWLAIRVGACQARLAATFGRPVSAPRPVAGSQKLCQFRLGESQSGLRVRQACSQQRTTVYHAFAAAVYFASARRIFASTKHTRHPRPVIPMTMEFDLRPRLHGRALETQSLGLFESIANVSSTARAEVHFWDLARHLQRQTDALVRRHRPLVCYCVPSMIFGHRAPGLDAYFRKSELEIPAIHVSCTGRYPYALRHGPIALETLYSMTTVPAWGTPWSAHLSEIDDQLTYVVVMPSSCAQDPPSRRLIDDVVELMDHCFMPRQSELTLMEYASAGE